jgi:hypothetical protein
VTNAHSRHILIRTKNPDMLGLITTPTDLKIFMAHDILLKKEYLYIQRDYLIITNITKLKSKKDLKM